MPPLPARQPYPLNPNARANSQVREFDVVDAVPFAVDFTWDKDGKPTTQRLFERNSPFPAAKMLTFVRSQPFSIAAVVPETGEKIGEYQVSLPAFSLL